MTKNVTEEQVKAALKAENKTIYWSPDGSMDDSFDIQAVTDLMENENGETYRVVVLRVKAGETYSIDAGELTFESEEASVTPFEKLDLTLSGETVTGEVTYAEPDTTYVLRTYLAGTEGRGRLSDKQSRSWRILRTSPLRFRPPHAGADRKVLCKLLPHARKAGGLKRRRRA